jgi:hypothetical protein
VSVLSSNQFGVWIARQSAKGFPATSAARQLRVVSGQMTTEKEQGSENYGDGRRFSTAADYVTTVMGSGEVTAQGTPADVAYLAHLILGGQAFSEPDENASGVNIADADENGGVYFTLWQSIGEGDTAIRQRYDDCRVGSLTLEASTGTPTLHAVANIMSLRPGHKIAPASVPTVAQSEIDPLLFTEGTGQLQIDGIAYGEISQFQVEITDELTPLFGDDTRPFDLAPGRSSATVSWTMVLTSDTLPMWNELVYGTTSPAAGAQPVDEVLHGSVNFKLSRGTGATEESVQISVPRIAFQPAPAVEFQPDGGAIELGMSGEYRSEGGSIEIICRGSEVGMIS